MTLDSRVEKTLHCCQGELSKSVSKVLDVLVVDDEPGIRAGLAYPLCDEGHQVTEAADGAEALRMISERVFDVVFCDIRLPKVDGLTLLRRIHRESPTTV